MTKVPHTIRAKIEGVLAKYDGPMTISQVAAEAGIATRVAGQNMYELSSRGVLVRVADGKYKIAAPKNDMRVEYTDPQITEEAFRQQELPIVEPVPDKVVETERTSDFTVVPATLPAIRRGSARKAGTVFELVESLPGSDILIKDEFDNFYKAEKVEVTRRLVIRTKSGEETIVK